MARKKKHEEHVNHERWLVSYADFITLLFAFFVVMFAVSQVDAKKLGRFTEAVQQATRLAIFEGQKGVSPVLPGEGVGMAAQSLARDLPRARSSRLTLAAVSVRLKTELAVAIDAQRVTVVQTDEGLVVRLRDAAFFASGSADIRDEVLSDLAVIGKTLLDLDNAVRIEGHTDSLPIRTAQYRSNWELSGARAASVLLYFSTTSAIPETRLSIAGYAAQRPIADNSTPDGRTQNRRVDVVVLRSAADVEAAEAAAPPSAPPTSAPSPSAPEEHGTN